MIWKIAVATMLLASTSFAGAILTGPSGNQPAPATITLQLSGVSSPINGIDLYPVVPAGKVLVVGMDKSNSVLSQTINPNIPVPTAAAPVDLASFVDWGLRSPSATVGTSANGPLVTLILALAPGVTSQQVTINGYWADTGFDEGDAGSVHFTLTPEPASMLLMAVGAAFFARRRRA